MKKIFILTLIIIFIPLLIVSIDHKEEIIKKLKYGIITNKIVKVKRVKTGTIEEIPLEKYVIGVVAGEVPATFNMEALKAQSVASRTYVLKRMNSNNIFDVEDGTNNQVYIDEKQMKEKWKDSYDKNYKKIKKAVNNTNGEVILYDDQLIDAMFFSSSNGYTENSENVFTKKLPYLTSVESSWDKEEYPAFFSSSEVSISEFLFNLGFDDTKKLKIEDIKRNSSGRVSSLLVNDKKITGVDIRKKFGLKSTSFTIKITPDKIIFNTEGFGHGVGMSQYGANGMAKEGYNYKDILRHYYNDIQIKKIN